MSMSSSCRSILNLLFMVGGVAAITSEMQGVLDKHNVYRCMHGVPLLTWDDAVAANAQAWATNGVYEHSDSTARVVAGVQLGENLAWGYPTRTGIDSTQAWYSEIEFTSGPYGTADSFDDATPAGNPIGHYTALVWSTSLTLGCGKGTATVSGNAGDYWVCQYGPAGNYMSQFSQKVLAPTVSLSSCGGVAGDVPSNFPASLGGGTSPSPTPSGGSGSSPTPTPPPGGSGMSPSPSGGSPSPTPSGAHASSCTPTPLLPVASLCVYGYQCASTFCCPRLKLCLPNGGGVSMSDINVPADQLSTFQEIVNGGTCPGASSATQQCYQTSAGQPLSSWDQSACGCKAAYMTHYHAGTWVTSNVGSPCASALSGTASMAVRFAAMPGRFALAVVGLLMLWSESIRN